jgi:Tol biopolymer transport system component
MRFQSLLCVAVLLTLFCGFEVVGDEPKLPDQLIGYTVLQTDLPGGRHANVRTMRAVVSKLDGSAPKELAPQLVDDPNSWTQFAGWSADGSQAIIARGWQDPENAAWEEMHRTFRMETGKWKLDSFLVPLHGNEALNVTAVDRVSDYNGGVFFLPDRKTLGFTALINGVSKPYLMDLNGRNKRDVSGDGGGFAYGYSASPDGKKISYHENYQIFIAYADGSNKKQISTGHPFNFGPMWSPDGQWLLFLSGEHGRSNPYLVRQDGTDLRKLADQNGYQGWILFLDVDDFHQGSSDTPVWSADGKSVFFTMKTTTTTELCQVDIEGKVTQLTKSAEGTLHYHPKPSADGQWLLYGSMRNGIRQLFVRNLKTEAEHQITQLAKGHAAMWAHWQSPNQSP